MGVIIGGTEVVVWTVLLFYFLSFPCFSVYTSISKKTAANKSTAGLRVFVIISNNEYVYYKLMSTLKYKLKYIQYLFSIYSITYFCIEQCKFYNKDEINIKMWWFSLISKYKPLSLLLLL